MVGLVKSRGKRDGKELMRKGETFFVFLFRTATQMQSHRHHTSYFLSPKVAANMCIASVSCTKLLAQKGMMDEGGTLSARRENEGEGVGVDGRRPYTIYTSGDVG